MGKAKKKGRRKRRNKKPEFPPMPNMRTVADKLNKALDDDHMAAQLQSISADVYELVLEASLLIGLEDELEAGGFAGVLFSLGTPDPDEPHP